ncbi:MAG TPA: M56 family metallopeptidase [Duganella sp.]|nr:M56 family metallopeptidase [Duganella sp.]
MNHIALESAVPALGWALLHFVWQGLIVGAVAAVILRCLHSASPRWRYAVCAIALLTCLCIPLTYMAWTLAQLNTLPSPPQAGAAPAWRHALQARMPSLVLAWSMGVALMMLRLSLGLAWVGWLRRQAVFAPAVWQGRLDAVALRMGLRRQVQLKLHASLSGPITLGFWRPIVILPAALLSGMPVDLLEALLAHELAHIRRWDYLVNLLQSLVEGLLFFHPVVWWLSRRMRIEREQVADELGALTLRDPSHMALALHALSLQSPGRQPGLAVPARGGALFRRIERLMAPTPAMAGWRQALPALLLACLSLAIQAPVPDATIDAGAASLLQLPVNAKHMLVLDETDGKVLMAKDANAVVPIASLTKLVTAMVVLDAGLDPDERLRVARADLAFGMQDDAMLTVGAEVSRDIAMQMALISSDNRAAAMLARTFPGGVNAFAQAVHAKLRSLGLAHTTMTDPTGAAPSNTSTAVELAKIVAAAARYPEIARITSSHRAEVAVNGRTQELLNTNPLVGDKGWDIRMSKTGSSTAAGRCLTMRMRSGDKNVTVVLLHAENSEQRTRDAGRIRDSLAQARRASLQTHS